MAGGFRSCPGGTASPKREGIPSAGCWRHPSNIRYRCWCSGRPSLVRKNILVEKVAFPFSAVSPFGSHGDILEFVDPVFRTYSRDTVSECGSQPQSESLRSVDINGCFWALGLGIVLSHQTQQTGQAERVISVGVRQKDLGDLAGTHRRCLLNLELCAFSTIKEPGTEIRLRTTGDIESLFFSIDIHRLLLLLLLLLVGDGRARGQRMKPQGRTGNSSCNARRTRSRTDKNQIHVPRESRFLVLLLFDVDVVVVGAFAAG
mmetsp:Transcript_3112/g.8128  ORF Transcript_3112/g.8128 Transcript_3112/m.8128 type:complete len:260 (-) Transcript_3112:282-1061(-)